MGKLTFALVLLTVFIEHYQCSLIDTAVYTASSVYKGIEATSLVWWNADSDNVTEFLKAYNGAIVAVSLHYDMHLEFKALYKTTGFKQTVFIASAVFEFEYFLKRLNRFITNPIKLILVNTSPDISILEISKTAWNNELYDIIICEESNGRITLFTYFPISENNCENYYPIAIEKYDDNLFPRKHNNFYGCPIKATVFRYPPYLSLIKINNTVSSISGIDGDIYKLIAKKLNGSTSFIEYSGGGGLGSFANGSGTGAFKFLIERKTDIIIPGGVNTVKRYAVAQMSPIFKTIDIYWCAPNRRELYVWARIFLNFVSRNAPYLFFTFIVFVTVVAIFKKIIRNLSRSRETVIFQALKMFLGQEAIFETNSKILNSLYIMWIWLCLVVRIVYQGDLVKGLHKQYLEAPMTILEEAVTRVEGYGGGSYFRDYYMDTSLGPNYKVLDTREIPKYINDIADGKRFLLATDILTVHQLRRVVQVLEEPITKTGTCFFMRPGWPAAREVNQIIRRAMEAGFVDQIFNNYLYEWKKSTEMTKDIKVAKPIDMTTLSACFYGVFIFWLLSFIIFILEIIFSKVTLKKRNT